MKGYIKGENKSILFDAEITKFTEVENALKLENRKAFFGLLLLNYILDSPFSFKNTYTHKNRNYFI